MNYSATATNRKISWIAREDDAGTLDLSPDFQRRSVWQPDQSSYLIDTVLSGLPFPEVYIRTETSPGGTTLHQVVDGQQRLRSILDFARNDLVLSGPHVSNRWSGKSFEDLADSEKKSFWNYDVVVRDLVDATDGDIRDLFRRLNLSAETLTPQELRHAKFTGRFKTLMEDLADDEWWLDARVVNVRQVRRMEDVEYVSELFIALMAGPQNKKDSLDQFYADLDGEFPDEAKWRAKFEHTRALVASSLDVDELRRWSGKSDFYTLFVAFGQYSSSKWTSGQSEAVRYALTRFKRQVDQAKRKDNEKVFSQAVHQYAEAVTRAATDIARRLVRLSIVSSQIKTALSRA